MEIKGIHLELLLFEFSIKGPNSGNYTPSINILGKMIKKKKIVLCAINIIDPIIILRNPP